MSDINAFLRWSMEELNLLNPPFDRYASKEIAEIFSYENKIRLWRKLWVALAESEMELGLPINKEQIEELKKYQNILNTDVAKDFEKETRHEVMAHIKAYGAQATSAAGIIHLGATSCYVLDNAEIIMIDNALSVISGKLLSTIDNLSKFAYRYKDVPALAYTHLQPAQLTTVGKRATLWIQDLLYDYLDLKDLKKQIKLRGVKGTTGTQASFLDLLKDGKKVDELERKVLSKMGYSSAYGVTGQTYPRKFDYKVLSLLSSIAQSTYKFSNDLRILQSFKEMEEPFEKTQVGSSAMAYKRNPMRSERISSLSRYVITLPLNASITSSTQWFERTLDDSANKRIVIPQAFYALDGILNLMLNVTEGLVVYEKVVEKRVLDELPFMATENIIMEGVKRGKSRQKLHEAIRTLSMKAAENVKLNGKENGLLDLIKNDENFKDYYGEIESSLTPSAFIGRAPEQVELFLENEVKPVLYANKSELGRSAKISV